MEKREKEKWTKKQIISYIVGVIFCLLFLVGELYFRRLEKEEQEAGDKFIQWEQALEARYGQGVKILSEEEGENKILCCKAQDKRTAEGDFYFTVYFPAMFSNFYHQLMKVQAQDYWEEGDRAYGFYSQQEEKLFEADSDRWNTRKYPKAQDLLWVECSSFDGIGECAKNIGDWLFYVSGDERFFGPLAGNIGREPLNSLWICTDKNSFLIEVSDIIEEIRKNGYDRGRIWQGIEALLESEGNIAFAWEEEDVEAEAEKKWEEYFWSRYQGEYEKECELENGRIRYRMVILDAAAGSRMYGLLKSTDAGESWQIFSRMPFGERMGMGIDFTFLDENFGFATLMHNGGDEAELFVTNDGGLTYEEVEVEEIRVTLSDGYEYNPYDYPQMPYEEEGKLYMLCGQGMDGDYEGGDAAGMALYESTDHGYSFTYLGIKKP